MTRDDFDFFCQNLKAVTHVVQWGGASVWKVGGKIFALCTHWKPAGGDCISFKCSQLGFHILCELPGIVPAPYLARGQWVQVQSQNALSEEDLKSYLAEAHAIIAAKLTKKVQAELGL